MILNNINIPPSNTSLSIKLHPKEKEPIIINANNKIYINRIACNRLSCCNNCYNDAIKRR